jgi:hypothetical protein
MYIQNEISKHLSKAFRAATEDLVHISLEVIARVDDPGNEVFFLSSQEGVF